MPAVPRLTGRTRENVILLIHNLATAGSNDPQIGCRLGLTVREVAALRKENGIPAGEQRWRGGGR
jgi:hypothetical protein